jgi:hypothetical protein
MVFHMLPLLEIMAVRLPRDLPGSSSSSLVGEAAGGGSYGNGSTEKLVSSNENTASSTAAAANTAKLVSSWFYFPTNQIVGNCNTGIPLVSNLRQPALLDDPAIILPETGTSGYSYSDLSEADLDSLPGRWTALLLNVLTRLAETETEKDARGTRLRMERSIILLILLQFSFIIISSGSSSRSSSSSSIRNVTALLIQVFNSVIINIISRSTLMPVFAELHH